MDRITNSNVQHLQITGSGVTIGPVSQHVQAGGAEEVEPPQLIRVLFLAANPAETTRLRLDREIQAIERALQAGGLHDRFDLQQVWAVGPEEIQDSLLRHRPDIVHFSGHGEAGGLILERPSSSAQRGAGSPALAPVPPPSDPIHTLAELFALARGSIRCVVLNACHSEAQAQGIAQHIDCAVGMSTELDDMAAIGFAWAFYHALGQGESVRKAFALACLQAKLAGGGPSGEPRLFAHRADPEALVFLRRQT